MDKVVIHGTCCQARAKGSKEQTASDIFYQKSPYLRFLVSSFVHQQRAAIKVDLIARAFKDEAKS